jgi:hypothetical protein
MTHIAIQAMTLTPMMIQVNTDYPPSGTPPIARPPPNETSHRATDAIQPA